MPKFTLIQSYSLRSELRNVMRTRLKCRRTLLFEKEQIYYKEINDRKRCEKKERNKKVGNSLPNS